MLKYVFLVIFAFYLIGIVYVFKTNQPKKMKISSVGLGTIWALSTALLFIIDSPNTDKTIDLSKQAGVTVDSIKIEPTKMVIKGDTATVHFDWTNTTSTETNFNGTGITVIATQRGEKLFGNYSEMKVQQKGQLNQKIDPNTNLEIDIEYVLDDHESPITLTFIPLEGKEKNFPIMLD